jgi:hypothetical protein
MCLKWVLVGPVAIGGPWGQRGRYPENSILIMMMIDHDRSDELNLSVPDFQSRSQFAFHPTGLLHRWDLVQMENLRRVSSTVVATVVTWQRMRSVLLGLI